jgi:hypothetical protein
MSSTLPCSIDISSSLDRLTAIDCSEVYTPIADLKAFKKVCAKLQSGVRFGVGFAFERTCGPQCHSCSGSAFDRRCRFFNFTQHHQVVLELKKRVPVRHVR